MSPQQSKKSAPKTPAAPMAEKPATLVDVSPTLPADSSAPAGFGRIPVSGVSPVIEFGAYPAKAVVGEQFPIRATVFREGHDAVKASVILTAPDGVTRRVDMHQIQPWGLDLWEAWVRLDKLGLWHFRIEGWSDPWHTWLHNSRAKLLAGVDKELVCLEGGALFERTAAQAADKDKAAKIRGYARQFDAQKSAAELLETTHSAELTWL
ncbi:MAG: DUF3416 domain-containing protein, partial [Propionibacteriaceae bacterium]|nr:DUF3416 domain-containing protein [Propionibacteriaceae bacterium]